MIPADETFDETWPYSPLFFSGSGFRQHYIDEGPRNTGETFVCVHGEPTWGYLYRNFIPALSKLGRVVVPDHMGFGKSETPQDRTYSIQEHTENLERLLLDLDLRDITLIVQDWGGPIGSTFAYRHPDRIKRLVVMNTMVGGQAPAGTPSVPDYPWFGWVHSDAFEPTILNLGSTALSVIKRIGFEHTAHVNETWVRAYSAPFPTAAECKGARQFPLNISAPETMKFVFENASQPGAIEAIKAKPAMMVTGAEDRAIPCEFAVACFRDMFPNAPVTILPGVGHFIQEDAPERVTALISQFVQLTQS
jgi:pimeloyl-ACP methyl ester carboxylesterase